MGTSTGESEVDRIAQLFEIPGEYRGVETLGSGHIHETWLATYADSGRTRRYVHQRLNTAIFRDPAGLMDNLARVTDHVRARLVARGVPDVERRCLRVVPARDGRLFAVDAEGGTWRTTVYQEGTRSFDTIQGPEQALRVARAFGEFATLLGELPPPPLQITIPDFHDLAGRCNALESTIQEDPKGRASSTRGEIDAIRRSRDRLAELLRETGADELPKRTMHNDCKLNNLLFDVTSGEALCVVDLDTVMEGTALNDFGELVRTGCCSTPEDIAPAHLDLELLRALARGYAEGASAWLTDPERRALPLAGPTLALENAVRFLADHLAGDVYFRIHRKGHNLDRSRAQLRRVDLLLENLDVIRAAIR
jgi:Ser/Thr protein kinase RdoA (MazF antagonist)